MPLFDRYLFIDWSSDSVPGPRTPSKDKIWIGEGLAAAPHHSASTYCRTRAAATELLRQRLKECVSRNERVLIGFDFPFGYPAGFADAICPGDSRPPWRRCWETLSQLIRDGDDNRNNRYEAAAELNQRCGPGPGPFWGCPEGRASASLTAGRKDAFTYPYVCRNGAQLERLRHADRGAPGVQEVWKLCYTGSVGSQALLGLPRVLSLRDDPIIAPHSAIWPFETGFTETPATSRPAILFVEIWPGLVKNATQGDAILDRAQVRAMVRWAAGLDASGELGAYFKGPQLSDAVREACISEEAWILGYR